MRKITYKLANGNVVGSYAMAIESGLPFRVELVEVKEERLPLSLKRAELMAKYGKVNPQ